MIYCPLVTASAAAAAAAAASVSADWLADDVFAPNPLVLIDLREYGIHAWKQVYSDDYERHSYELYSYEQHSSEHYEQHGSEQHSFKHYEQHSYVSIYDSHPVLPKSLDRSSSLPWYKKNVSYKDRCKMQALHWLTS